MMTPLARFQTLPAHTQAQLNTYMDLLERWNHTYRLTGYRTREAIFQGFILESLALLPHVEGHTFVDLGTGAGVPGLILAIARPDISMTLIDSNLKKIRFLRHVIAQLNLSHVTAIPTRIESYQPQMIIDGLFTKAFATLEKTHTLCKHLSIRTHYALKGPQGIAEAEHLVQPHQIIPLNRSSDTEVLIKIDLSGDLAISTQS